jgi:hypothetical protein
MHYSGAPIVLEDEWYQAALASTTSTMREEEVRTRKGFARSSPAERQPYTGDIGVNMVTFIGEEEPAAAAATVATAAAVQSADPLEIWKMLPALKHLPEDMLRQLSRAEIFQLNTALLKESKVTNKLQTNARLMMNAQQLVSNPVNVPAGKDDRKSVLHRARFLGGASCSAQALWLQAREELGLNGVTPIGNYDLDSVGCGGCVTPKAWLILHDPSSPELKLKLFHMANVGSSLLPNKRISLDDGDGINIGDNLRDIADMEAFKSALNVAREAMATALPWNRSISAIVGFFVNNNYCASELGANPKKAAVLAEFCDYCFGRNALNWENGQAFLSTDDIAHAWAAWRAKRATIFAASGDQKKKQNNFKKDDICRRYNTASGCPFSATDCKTFTGVKLRHVCNQFMPGGRKCEKDHPRPDHK